MTLVGLINYNRSLIGDSEERFNLVDPMADQIERTLSKGQSIKLAVEHAGRIIGLR